MVHRIRRLAPAAGVVALLLVVSACTSAGAPAAARPSPAASAAANPTAASAAAASAAAPASVAPTAAPTTAPAPSAAATSAAGGYGYGDGYGGYGGTKTAAPAAPPAAATGALAGKDIAGVGTVLVAPDGMTLYTYKPDGAGSSACTGGCAQAWPPLAAKSVPALPAGWTGKVSLITRDDGSQQVAYDGHPLYGYSGDMGHGDANGQGLGGVWFVVTK
jgi:predicted lipoprotein with Yx(FWY)xxD motif